MIDQSNAAEKPAVCRLVEASYLQQVVCFRAKECACGVGQSVVDHISRLRRILMLRSATNQEYRYKMSVTHARLPTTLPVIIEAVTVVVTISVFGHF